MFESVLMLVNTHEVTAALQAYSAACSKTCRRLRLKLVSTDSFRAEFEFDLRVDSISFAECVFTCCVE